MILKDFLGLLQSVQRGIEMNRIEEVQQELEKYINKIEMELEND